MDQRERRQNKEYVREVREKVLERQNRTRARRRNREGEEKCSPYREVKFSILAPDRL